MGIKINQLVGYSKTEIKVYETNESGELEELVHSPKHKKVTSEVLQKLDQIEDRIKKENKELFKKDPLGVQKNVIAEQLAFLVEGETDLWDGDQQLKPSVETYSSLSLNYLSTTLYAIVGSVTPKKPI